MTPARSVLAGLLALAGAAGCARPDNGALEPASPPPPATFDCGGRSVTAQIGDGSLTLVLDDGTPVVLPLVEDAAGARFQRGDTLFWMLGTEAALTLGDARAECTIVGDDLPDEPVGPQPLFHGVGQEPGWTVDVFPDRIDFLGDYGERHVVVPRPEPERRDGRTRYRVETEANDFTLTIETRPCRDGMSGQPYPATVVVEVNGDRYRGCGR